MSDLRKVEVKLHKDTLAVIEYRARQRGISNTEFVASAVRLTDMVTDRLRAGATLQVRNPDGSIEDICMPRMLT